ncbi:MAG: DUF1028 domain-containing protein [Bacteroidota bacterium]
MMKKILLSCCLLLCTTTAPLAQDTFSILAIDPDTKEIGSAGASCVDLFAFSGLSDDFLGEIFPGIGVIHTQAFYVAANQANARNQMNQGKSAQEIIDWLVANDVFGQPELRQYGVVRWTPDGIETAAHTGNQAPTPRAQITGDNYTIIGNVIASTAVVDSMEAAFLRAEGDLACKLMAAMDAAKRAGGDARCTDNGTSSLFAFLKVAQASDTFGDPSFLISVRTRSSDGIEPVDSLQTLFDQRKNCQLINNLSTSPSLETAIRLHPNPSSQQLYINHSHPSPLQLQVFDSSGRLHQQQSLRFTERLSTDQWPNGMYYLQFSTDQQSWTTKIVIHH